MHFSLWPWKYTVSDRIFYLNKTLTKEDQQYTYKFLVSGDGFFGENLVE